MTVAEKMVAVTIGGGNNDDTIMRRKRWTDGVVDRGGEYAMALSIPVKIKNKVDMVVSIRSKWRCWLWNPTEWCFSYDGKTSCSGGDINLGEHKWNKSSPPPPLLSKMKNLFLRRHLASSGTVAMLCRG